MCGVLYFKGEGKQYKRLLMSLLRESKVRGLHAFGISLRSSLEEEFQTIRTFSLHEAEQYIYENEFIELIGHCRYDTSGDWRVLENNQPIVIGNNILVFNGVVRMSTREEYQTEFEREYLTENDGEIVLRMLVEEDRRLMSLLEEQRVTFAGVIHVNGKTLALRNERRPLWRIRFDGNTTFVFSTADIWMRAIAVEGGGYSMRTIHQLEEVPLLEAVWL
jgi:glutamine phosphoribosylpyrophosphate amidotransferase